MVIHYQLRCTAHQFHVLVGAMFFSAVVRRPNPELFTLTVVQIFDTLCTVMESRKKERNGDGECNELSQWNRLYELCSLISCNLVHILTFERISSSWWSVSYGYDFHARNLINHAHTKNRDDEMKAKIGNQPGSSYKASSSPKMAQATSSFPSSISSSVVASTSLLWRSVNLDGTRFWSTDKAFRGGIDLYKV
jgi:hypothetical protein